MNKQRILFLLLSAKQITVSNFRGKKACLISQFGSIAATGKFQIQLNNKISSKLANGVLVHALNEGRRGIEEATRTLDVDERGHVGHSEGLEGGGSAGMRVAGHHHLPLEGGGGEAAAASMWTAASCGCSGGLFPWSGIGKCTPWSSYKTKNSPNHQSAPTGVAESKKSGAPLMARGRRGRRRRRRRGGRRGRPPSQPTAHARPVFVISRGAVGD